MRVLSLFDGISGTQQALKNLGITPEVYYASEIDKYAISVTMKNFPNTIQLGDVTKLHDFDFGKIDLMTWGSPCQDLSIAKKDRQGLNGVRSGLFYDAVKIWQRVKPKYWLMENVASMPKESMHEISRILGTYPITINSALVTAQQRKRYYWTNITGNSLIGDIPQPQDRNILLKDILESGIVDKDKSNCLRCGHESEKSSPADIKRYFEKSLGQIVYEPIRIGEIGKGGQGAKTGLYQIATNTKLGYDIAREIEDGIRLQFPKSKTARGRVTKDKANNLDTGCQVGVIENYTIRKLTPVECERLQAFPDEYTSGISNTQRYKCLGNSFTVTVIEHILSFI